MSRRRAAGLRRAVPRGAPGVPLAARARGRALPEDLALFDRRADPDRTALRARLRRCAREAGRGVGGIPYDRFILPGLIVQALVTVGFVNGTTSLFEARNDRYIHGVLASPLRWWEINLALVLGGVVREILVGSGASSRGRSPGWESRVRASLASGPCAARHGAQLGVLAGVYARSLDDIYSVETLVVLPLGFLSGIFYTLSPAASGVAGPQPFEPGLLLRSGVPGRVPGAGRPLPASCSRCLRDRDRAQHLVALVFRSGSSSSHDIARSRRHARPGCPRRVRLGGMVVVADDEDRENEGDLIAAAQLVTPDAVAFMVHHGSGIVCVAMEQARLAGARAAPNDGRRHRGDGDGVHPLGRCSRRNDDRRVGGRPRAHDRRARGQRHEPPRPEAARPSLPAPQQAGRRARARRPYGGLARSRPACRPLSRGSSLRARRRRRRDDARRDALPVRRLSRVAVPLDCRPDRVPVGARPARPKGLAGPHPDRLRAVRVDRLRGSRRPDAHGPRLW